MSEQPSKEQKTIMGLYELMTELNPRISQFRPYMYAISHAEEITEKFDPRKINVSGDK